MRTGTGGHDPILHRPRKSVKKVTVEWNGLLGKERGTRQHPTQKPLELMKWCADGYSDPSDTILDPFMGSGTTRGVGAVILLIVDSVMHIVYF